MVQSNPTSIVLIKLKHFLGIVVILNYFLPRSGAGTKKSLAGSTLSLFESNIRILYLRNKTASIEYTSECAKLTIRHFSSNRRLWSSG